MLEVNDVTKTFGGLVALRSLSFSVDRGEVVGIIGPNGAGKSTLFEVISGFEQPTGGQIILDGERIDGLTPHQICRRGLARSFQLPESLPHFTAFDFILLSALPKMPMVRARQQTMKTLQVTELTDKVDYPLFLLADVERRRAELGVVFNSQFKLALLDEPFSGLGENDVRWLQEVIRELRRNGSAFLIVEHRIQFIKLLCDRIIAINLGQKIAEGTAEEVMTDEAVINAYFGKEE